MRVRQTRSSSWAPNRSPGLFAGMVAGFVCSSLIAFAQSNRPGEHWSFSSPGQPALPQVSDARWPRNPIDYFILVNLERAGLKPSPPADKRTLLRRVSLDLLGLPPTADQIAAFLADQSDDGYEKVVDRLLASPRFGERMALEWLDAARYADTHGYHEDYHRDMWPWREWVINALNAKMPFDQFTIEQLAGDLLPGATNGQIIATGFNRNHGVTASGISEEYRVEYVLDRVRATSTVWLGMTLHCAQCHDHKYDPISQEEFYRFFAYFNSITDKGVENKSGNVDPLVKVESPSLKVALEALHQQITQVAEARRNRAASADSALAQWEQRLAANGGVKTAPPPAGLRFHYPLDSRQDKLVANAAGTAGHGSLRGKAAWTGGRFAGALDCGGEGYAELGDVAGFDRNDSFSYGGWIRANGGGAVIARMDDAAAYRGWDLFVTGNHVEAHLIHSWPSNAIHAKAKSPLTPREWTHVFVTYDGSSEAAGLRIYIDGKPQELNVTRDQLTETIQTSKPLHIGRRNPSAVFPGAIDDVRIYDRALSDSEVATLAAANPVVPILAISKSDRSERQNQTVREYFLANHDTEYQNLSIRLSQLRARQTELRDQGANLTVMVMQEMESPRGTFVLNRGQYDQRGSEVQSGTPSFLPPLPADAPPSRLALAHWLVSPTHPLTARVTVNRMWQLLFGTGIVKTSEDFGTQGELPSHPELLDWLARELIRADWDVASVLKLIVTSATYRQSARVSPAVSARDPDNRLLSRGPRFRLPAELIRDNALTVSGLLVERLGGPSVKPYQPGGLWKETSNRGYEQDHGSKLYRRSLYTYWKRSVPPPNMFAIDAPTRETCTVRRQRTNTPLMALVMLNDPTFVEAARELAGRAMEQTVEPQRQIAVMFETATARQPRPEEAGVLLAVYHRQVEVFLADKPAALKLLSVGDSLRNPKLDPAEQAALSTVASVILNLDETITKE